MIMVSRFFLAFAVIGLVLFTSDQVQAAYCDRVQGGDLNDPNLLWCEDWEHPAYYENHANAWYQGESLGGNWNRGGNSLFENLYHNGVNGALFSNSNLTPRIGNACQFGACTGTKEYCSTAQGNLVDGKGADCWGPGVNATAFVDVQRDGDVEAEVSGLKLVGGNNGQVFDGKAHLAYRVGRGQTNGIVGGKNWTPVKEIGITMALAYSSNIGGSGILDWPWKHDEWGGLPWAEHWNLGLTGAGGSNVYPYSPFMFNKGQSSCNSALSKATLLVGRADCSDVALRMGADPGVYNQATDFPWGTWGCHQAHISGMGTQNVTIKIWHNSVLIFHLTGFDGSALVNQSYGTVNLNAYANANQGLGETPTTQTAYRYQDNIHVRSGPPVSCAQIGFGGGPVDTTPPKPPANLRVE